MSKQRRAQLKMFEGRHVNISLRNGCRIDNCQLVSSGRTYVPHLWLYANGADTFVPLDEVVDMWAAA